MSKAADLARTASASETALSNRNLVINGAMQISQRATSVTGIGASAGYFTLDRFDMFFSGTAGRLTMSQDSNAPEGFGNSLKLDCTTADTSIAAGEVAMLQYQVEGQDLQQLKKGTSNAEKVTVSFYVKGNANATYTLELQDNDNSRHIAQTFNVTTSWNRVSLTFAGDTTGAFGDDNACSLRVQIYLQAGSTYTSGTFTSNTWSAITNANTVKSDQTMFFDSTARTLSITGLQMEVSPVATPFEHLSFGQNLALCQRYYWNTYNGAAIGSNTGQVNVIGRSAGGQSYETISEGNFPTTMRAVPTMQIYNPITGTAGSIRGDSSNFATCQINFRGVNYYSFNMAGVAIGQSTFVSGNVTADAEL